METNDISEIEINEELRGMISGNFENTSDVESQENIEIEVPRLVENLEEDEEIKEIPFHRFVVKEDSEKITLYIGDNYIYRRRYIRGDSATFTCTGCEKVSRKTRGGNKGKKDAWAVAQITDDGYVLQEAADDDEH